MRNEKKLHFLLNLVQKAVFPEKASVPDGQYNGFFPKIAEKLPLKDRMSFSGLYGGCLSKHGNQLKSLIRAEAVMISTKT